MLEAISARLGRDSVAPSGLRSSSAVDLVERLVDLVLTPMEETT
jgi:hypothetical protein